MNKQTIQIPHIMNKEISLDNLKKRMRTLGLHILTVLIDGLFLALWAVFHYGLDSFVIRRLGLSGINRWMFICFQIAFALSTLAPVLLYIYEHTAIMVIKTQRRIRQELHGKNS